MSIVYFLLSLQINNSCGTRCIESKKMLDQTFTYNNIETVFGSENRKGNIDINWLPEEYRSAAEEMKTIRKKIAQIKSKKEKSISEIEWQTISNLENDYKNAKERKRESLKLFFIECEKQINSSLFHFQISSYINKSNKEVFLLNNKQPDVFFALKILQNNIQRTFKVKQANRHSIISTIKTILRTKTPLYIIRTDIRNFYESIPYDSLIKIINNNPILNHKSKEFIRILAHDLYEMQKDDERVPKNIGIPRGVGISPLLSEIYLRDLDELIRSKQEVVFYARYVDDIFIILSTIPYNDSLIDYYKGIQFEFQKVGLTLKDPNSTDGECRLIELNNDVTIDPPFDYLGYRFYLKREKGIINVELGLSSNKKEKYKNKIDNIEKHFIFESNRNIKKAYQDLFDAVHFISGNTKLHKSKARVKIGLYYSNDLLDKMDDLDEIQSYLRSKSFEPSHSATGWEICKKRITDKINSIDFQKSWREKKIYYFSMERHLELRSMI